MRKGIILFFAILNTGFISADGLVTRTNQSAAWVRLPARNASAGIDAVYYNPAGLIRTDNGFHISISNQSVFQKRIVENTYSGPGGFSGLNNNIYTGVSAEIITPSFYAVYKTDRFAVSFGYNKIGGEGKVTYKEGLPSYEINHSDIVQFLPSAAGITAYNSDIRFIFSSAFHGFQGGISFKINDLLSVAAGIRYVSAKKTINGHIRDIQVLNDQGMWNRADMITNNIASVAYNAYDGTNNDRGTTDLVIAGLGSLYLAQVPDYYISQERRSQLEGALTTFGYPANTIIEDADSIFKGAAEKYYSAALLLEDGFADVAQSGSGITPVFSINISPADNLNISIKYELATKLEMINKTSRDLIIGYTADKIAVTMYPDESLQRNDLPAMLSLGINYRVSPALEICFGSDYFFDKTADYGHKIDDDINSSTPSVNISNDEIIEKNGLSFQAGAEYSLSKKILISGGYVRSDKGVNDEYQSDLTYGLANQTFGAGGAYSVSDQLQLNMGFGYTAFKTDKKLIDHIFPGTGADLKALESYSKSTFMIAVGLDFRF